VSEKVLIALGKEADFLYSTFDTYIEDAKKDNRQHLVERTGTNSPKSPIE
jgi:hypothetical protein